MILNIEYPLAFLGLLLLIPAILIFSVQYKKFAKALGILSTQVSTQQKVSGSVLFRIKFRMVCWSFAWTCLIFALADISWGTEPVPVQRSGAAVSLVFDISYSMMAEDVPAAPRETRLSASTLFAKSLLNNFNGYAVSAVIAKGDGVIAVPLTEDVFAVDSLLDSLSPTLITAPGSSLGKGIEAAVRSFPSQSSRNSTIILFTDGDETDNLLEKAVTEAISYGIHVIIVGFGSEDGTTVISGDGHSKVETTLQTDKLRRIVEKSNERNTLFKNNQVAFFNASEKGAATRILRMLEQSMGQDQIQVGYEMKPVRRYGLFVFLGLLFFIIGICLAELRSVSQKTPQKVVSFLIILIIPFFSSCTQNLGTAGKVLENTLYWYQKNYQKSVAGFLEITETAQANGDNTLLQYGLFGLSSAYIMQDEGESALNRMAEIAPDAPSDVLFAAYYNAGIIAHQKGDYKKAAEDFKNALLIDSTNIDAKINLELSLRQNNTSDTAKEQNITPVSESPYQSTLQDTIFSVIRENDKNRWKNAAQDYTNSSVIDY